MSDGDLGPRMAASSTGKQSAWIHTKIHLCLHDNSDSAWGMALFVKYEVQ